MYNETIHNTNKLNRLLTTWPHGLILTNKYLESKSYSRDLLRKYCKGGWIVSIGRGAVAKKGNNISWIGGLNAVQTQLGLQIQPGGLTALEIHGKSQYIPTTHRTVLLFSNIHQSLPVWFRNYDWNVKIEIVKKTLFDENKNTGIQKKEFGGIDIWLSSAERAILEALSLVENKYGFSEVSQIFEGLMTLRPDLINDLLRKCKSIQAKRLFMYLAKSFEMPWLDGIDLSNVNLGKGKRVLVKGGRLDPEYLITVPRKDVISEEGF